MSDVGLQWQRGLQESKKENARKHANEESRIDTQHTRFQEYPDLIPLHAASRYQQTAQQEERRHSDTRKPKVPMQNGSRELREGIVVLLPKNQRPAVSKEDQNGSAKPDKRGIAVAPGKVFIRRARPGPRSKASSARQRH